MGAQRQANSGLRRVQEFAKGRKEVDLWEIHYTDSKAVTTSPVDLAPMV
jgi:hypothetical protein